MTSQCCPGHALRKIGSFAAIGFLTILLAGPVLGLLSVLLSIAVAVFSAALTVFLVLLPFVIVGFVIMAPIEGRPDRPANRVAPAGRHVQGPLAQDLGLGLVVLEKAVWTCPFLPPEAGCFVCLRARRLLGSRLRRSGRGFPWRHDRLASSKQAGNHYRRVDRRHLRSGRWNFPNGHQGTGDHQWLVASH